MSSASVAVIGAGIGGLTTALALQQRGYEVRVYEQAGRLGEIGAGVHLSPGAAAFDAWHATVRALVRQALAGECYKWALLGRDPLPYGSTGRTTLLGDAAHPMVPYLAQGAVMAVEDGWTLAACLAAQTDTAAALKAYEDARLPRTAAMQAAAWEQGRLNHAVGRDTGGDDFAGGGFADPGWIYGYDAVALFPPSA